MNHLRMLKDLQLINQTELFKQVRTESAQQVLKWGVQERTPFEWMCYLTEETGELAEAISEREYREGTDEQVTMEAIQVATLAIKVAEMYLDSSAVVDDSVDVDYDEDEDFLLHR